MHCSVIDAVLIDDDTLIHAVWEFSAERHGIRLVCFEDSKAFFQRLNEFHFDTPIYVDSNLGAGVKGEQVTKQIYKLGFNNIYLETGDITLDLSKFHWLKGIICKSPPWEENNFQYM